MTVKEQILEYFETHRGQYLSGGELAAALGVSRSAVWKAVRQLESEGFRFAKVTGKGYCLCEDSDGLTEQSVRRCLGEAGGGLDIRVLASVTSTNTLLKEMAASGAPEGTVLVACRQTAGRGRMERAFFSPSDTGLYLSLLLRPQIRAQEALFITTAAAVAVAQTVEELAGKPAGIKWVNDVFMNGRKVCGILTEASLDMESGSLEYAVCGIGVNLRPPEGGFPEAIQDVAGAVFPDGKLPPDARSRLAAGILRRLISFYRALPAHPFFEEYVRRSVVVGQDILVLRGGEGLPARALAIDGDAGLHVRYGDGREEVLTSGEVSIRIRDNTD